MWPIADTVRFASHRSRSRTGSVARAARQIRESAPPTWRPVCCVPSTGWPRLKPLLRHDVVTASRRPTKRGAADGDEKSQTQRPLHSCLLRPRRGVSSPPGHRRPLGPPLWRRLPTHLTLASGKGESSEPAGRSFARSKLAARPRYPPDAHHPCRSRIFFPPARGRKFVRTAAAHRRLGRPCILRCPPFPFDGPIPEMPRKALFTGPRRERGFPIGLIAVLLFLMTLRAARPQKTRVANPGP